MKYMKLYENFQERKPISDVDWKLFENVNKKFRKRLWLKKYLVDNGDGTFDYENGLDFSGMEIVSLKELIPFPIKNVKEDFYCSRCNLLENLEGSPTEISGGFYCSRCENLSSLKGCPTTVGGSFWCNDCNLLENLEGSPITVGRDINCSSCNNLSSLKGCPTTVDGSFWCSRCNNLTSLKGCPTTVGRDFDCDYCTGLISDVNDHGHKIKGWDGILPSDLERFLNSEHFSLPIWYESLAFVGARDPKAYDQVCKDFPNGTTFTQEQIEEIYKSDLIDQESTLVDAVKAGLPVPQEIMDRTKKYDHSEYRDSKLDSEWKDVF